jgi:hypothetical protein
MIPGIVAGQASAYMPPGNLWTPANLAVAAKIWCDDSSIVDSGGGVSGQWTDKSANGWHFTQATSGNRPQILAAELNGHSVLRFDGSDDRLTHSGSGTNIFRNTGSGWSLTLYKKRSSTISASSSVVFYSNASSDIGQSNRFNVIAIRSGTVDKGAFASRRQLTDTPAIIQRTASDIGNWVMRLDIADWANGDVFMHVNGELDASDTTTLSAGTTSNVAVPVLSIGSGGISTSDGGTSYCDIDMAVLIAGSGSLPDAGEIDKLFGWAAWRYGLQGNLPDDHPYKDAPPTV